MKPLKQILWDIDLAPSLLKGVETTDAPTLDSKPAAPLDDKVSVAEPLPSHGPPREWVRHLSVVPATHPVDMERNTLPDAAAEGTGSNHKEKPWQRVFRMSPFEVKPHPMNLTSQMTKNQRTRDIRPVVFASRKNSRQSTCHAGDRVPAPVSLDAPTPEGDLSLESGNDEEYTVHTKRTSKSRGCAHAQ